MKLEFHIIEIRGVRFGNNTRIHEGVLTINHDELQELLEKDKSFERVEIELASPGEKCRILRVADVIEPRVKMEIGEEDFLTFAEKHSSTGDGKTCVLRGASIVLLDLRTKGGDTTGMSPRDHIIDMSGPGGEYGDYSKTFNIALLAQPREKVSGVDYLAAIKNAD